MNFTVNFLILQNNFFNPFLINNNIKISNSIIFKNFYCFKKFKNNLNFFKNIFKNNLETSIYINSYHNLYFIGIFTPLNILNSINISNCIFKNNFANGNSAGILINSITSNSNIINCLFKSLKATSGGAGIYTSKSNSINIINCCFDNCSSPHGQSYTLANNHYDSTYRINYSQMNFTLEINVGIYTNIPIHSSFIGCFTNFIFYNNNISKCQISGRSSGFYFYCIPHNSKNIFFNQIINTFGSFIIEIMHSNNIEFSYFNILNNSLTNKWFSLISTTLVLNNIIFLNNSHLPITIDISISLNNCVFSNIEDSTLKQLNTFYNCSFNQNVNLIKLQQLYCFNFKTTFNYQYSNFIFKIYYFNLIQFYTF